MKYFAIIGAQRSGTTSLYHMLDSHPQINMVKPVQPEPRLFMTSNEDKKRQDIQILNTRMSGWVGEKSTAYMDYPAAARLIRKKFNDAKAIAILRNPVERALSHYHYSVNNGLEKQSITDAILKQKDTPMHWQISMNPFAYLNRGCYYNYLKPWKAVFGNDLLVLRFEDLIEGRQLGSIFDFLQMRSTDRCVFGHYNRLDYEAEGMLADRLQSFYKPHNELLKNEYGITWE